MKADPVFLGSEARRLLEEPLLIAAFDKLESDAMEEALRVPSWHRWGQKRRDALLQRVHVIRDLRSSLKATVAAGDQVAKRDQR